MRKNWFILLILLASCGREYPAKVEYALQLAGENRREIEKVIRHYRNPDDSLKLEAAYFLVGNMPGEGYQYGPVIDQYNKLFDVLAGKSEEWKKLQPWYATTIDAMIDSLAQLYGTASPNKLTQYADLQELDAKFLITHINEAFEAWQQPWCKHISFDQFCEYILPYRTFNEQPEYWREMFKNEYAFILDSVENTSDVLEVGYHLNQAAMPYFSLGFDKYPVSIAPSNLLKGNFGNCSNNSNHKMLAFRAMGVPVALDFIPIYGNNRNKHYWNSTLDKEAKPVSFEKPLKDPNSEVIFLPKFTLTKIFRKTFAHQEAKIRMLQETQNSMPQNLRDTKYIDVTAEYIPTTDVELQLRPVPEGEKYAYLCVFNNSGWYPVHYGKIKDNGRVVFTQMGRNVVYLPVFYQSNGYIAAGDPFLLTKEGETKSFSPNQSKVQSLSLTRKYDLEVRKVNWQKCLVNGKFQGANTADFSDAVTLSVVRKMPSQHMESVKVNSDGSFRYFRFLFDIDTNYIIKGENDGATIAELQFYKKKGRINFR